MRRMLVRSAVVIFFVVVTSGLFFEWVLTDLMEQGSGTSSLDQAFLLSLVFDVGLVILAASALSWPLYRKIQRLESVAQKQQEGQLHVRANLRGSDALAKFAQSFDALADANEKHLENQRELLRAISHELRTPVSRLRFALEDLVCAPENKKDALRSRADADIDELDTLIEEILAYARVAPGGAPRDIAPFDLIEVLTQVLQESPKASFQVKHPETLACQGEAHLIRRALSNIVRNAVYYAKSQVSIEVNIDSQISVRVLDDGPGLPADADERLFLPFVRYNPKGVGLGTSIALAIAKRHGGSLRFHPRPPGTGALFEMQLPREMLDPSKTSTPCQPST